MGWVALIVASLAWVAAACMPDASGPRIALGFVGCVWLIVAVVRGLAWMDRETRPQPAPRDDEGAPR